MEKAASETEDLSEAPPLLLPDGFEWFAEQIAGHHPSVIKNGKRQLGLLHRFNSSLIHKPVQIGVRGYRELALYKLLFSVGKCAKEEDALKEEEVANDLEKLEGELWKRLFRGKLSQLEKEWIERLRLLVANFWGIETLSIGGEDHSMLVLDDVTHKYKYPAILDVKMGSVTSDPAATEAKAQSEASKYPPQVEIGFRLSGYRMHTERGLIVKDKDWGKSFDETNIHQGLREFFSGRPWDASLLPSVLLSLQNVLSWFYSQRLFHFYASSLLFVYETHSDMPANVDLRLIDFSHVFPANGIPDGNYIPGLERLITLLTSIQ